MTVVDASVWVSRLVPQDVHHEASRGWLAHHLARGGDLPTEAGNPSSSAASLLYRNNCAAPRPMAAVA